MNKTIDYTKTSTKSFADLVQAVQDSAAKRNFRTLHIHDVQATLKEKDLEIGGYKIIEVCNAGLAYKVITAHHPVGMMLPCRILVAEVGDEKQVMLMLPSLMTELMPEADFGGVPEDVEETLKQVVDEAVA